MTWPTLFLGDRGCGSVRWRSPRWLLLALVLFLAVFNVELRASGDVATRSDQAEATLQIDEILARHWAVTKTKPNPVASDEVFVRRVYLDVAGRIPTFQEAQSFLESQQTDKRARLIENLLKSEAYVQNYFNLWADVLRAQTRARVLGPSTGYAYSEFIKQSLRENKPYDQFVRELISAQGVSWENGAIGYYLRDMGMPLDNLALTSRIFLGTRLECAQCHDHPFEKWRQMDFYHLAAFTYPVDEGDAYERIGLRAVFKKREKDVNLHQIVKVLNQIQGPFLGSTELRDKKRELKLPHDYQYQDAKPFDVVKPQTIFGAKIAPAPGDRGPDAFAKWVASPENPYFTRVVVNRLWKRLFGRGVIEHFDDLNEEVKGSVPELVLYLEKLLIQQRYDLRAFLAAVLNSRAYQSEASNAELVSGDPYPFAGPLLRRLTAEQIWDSFVTLIRTEPDAPNSTLRAQARDRINQSRKINDAFLAMPPDELFNRVLKASASFVLQGEKLKALQAQIDEARAAKNEGKIKALAKHVAEYEAETRQSVIENVLQPMLARLVESKGGDPSTVQIPWKKGDTPKGSGTIAVVQFVKNTKINGYDELPTESEQKKQLEAARREAARASVVSNKDFSAFSSYFDTINADFYRAAELDSPAPRGHLLRDLGQSDREFVDNASTEASIGHALLLMNSNLIPQVLNRFSALSRNISEAKDESARVDAVFVSLLSRKPTAAERATWTKASENGMKIEDLIHSLLNTQQFLFAE